MTKAYETPSVMHIMECDDYGNTRIVRYYREDIIKSFADTCIEKLNAIQEEADSGETERSK